MSLFDGSLELSNEMMVNENNWSMIKSGFHEELTKAIKIIIDTETPRTFYRNKEAQKRITDVIAKHTGIGVNISAEHRCFAMVPPDLNKNHTLIDFDQRIFFDNEELKRQQGNIRGSLDIKNFKIGGDFKNVVVDLFIGPDMMWPGYYESNALMTPAEISAVILHEVGHMFSYFALVAHTYSINLPMLGTLNRIAKTEDADKIEIILKQWNSNETTLTKVDTKELSGKRKEIIVTAIVSNHVQDTKTLMSQREYEEINAEHLADKFAVRCGAGGDLSSGLNKILQLYGVRSTMTMTGFVINEIITGMVLLMMSAFTVVGMAMILPGIIGLIITIEIFKSTSNAGDGTYDTEVNRFGRMRNDMVTMLKDKNIDKAIGKRIRDDISRIDKVLTNYKEYKSLIGSFADMIIPSKRRLLSQTEFYKELEKLSSNNLFVAAYDLRNLK